MKSPMKRVGDQEGAPHFSEACGGLQRAGQAPRFNIPASLKGGRLGFTLIELLVVVTIIAVLLALLAPALDKAVGIAQEAKCLSNLHQIGLGMHFYTGEYRRYFPPKYTPGTTTSGTYVGPQGVPTTTNTVSIYWWVGTAGSAEPFLSFGAQSRYLNPYMGYANAGPTTPVPVALCPAETDSPRRYDTGGTSYASNHSLSLSSLLARQALPAATDNPIATALPKFDYAGIRTSRVQNAATLVVGGDAPGVLAGWNFAPPAPAWHREDTYALLFVDGHVSMATYQWGAKTGDGYTFDETGRE